MRLEPADLRELVRAVRDGREAAAEEKNLALEVHVSDDVDRVSADPRRVRQVMGNLLQGSVKLTPPGGARVRLRVTPRRATWRSRCSLRARGSRRKTRSGSSTASGAWAKTRTEVEGSGLEFAVAETIVRAHGGRIRARNRDEGGAEITFVPPRASDATDQRASDSTSGMAAQPDHGWDIFSGRDTREG